MLRYIFQERPEEERESSLILGGPEPATKDIFASSLLPEVVDPKKLGASFAFSGLFGDPPENMYQFVDQIEQEKDRALSESYIWRRDIFGKRGVWDEMAAAFKAGGIGTVEMYTRAADVMGIEVAPEQYERLKELKFRFQQTNKGAFWDAVYGGIESTYQSITGMLPGAVGGFFLGGPKGAAVGGSLSAAGLFSVAEYHRFMEEAREVAEAAGLEFDRDTVLDEAIISAASEGLIEGVTDLVGAKIFGFLGKNPIMRQATKDTLLKAFGKFMGKLGQMGSVEIPGEMATAAIQNQARLDAGIDTGITNWEAAKQVIGPAIVQTILMGGAGQLGQTATAAERAAQEGTLNPDAEVEVNLTEKLPEKLDIREGPIGFEAEISGAGKVIADSPEGIQALFDELRRQEADITPDTRPEATLPPDQTIDDLIQRESEEDFIKGIGEIITDAEEAFMPEAGAIDLTSEVTVQGIREELATAKDATARLFDVGKSIFQEGHQELKTFTARMKEVLGDLWERFKGSVKDIFNRVVEFNQRLGERGSIELFGKGQPLEFDPKKRLDEMSELVEKGAPGRRFEVEGEWTGTSSQYPDFMRDQGWSQNDVLSALKKAREGKPITERQRDMVLAALAQAQEKYLNEIAETSGDFLDVSDQFDEAQAHVERIITEFLAKVRIEKPSEAAQAKKALKEVEREVREKEEQVGRLQETVGKHLSQLWELQDAMKELRAQAREEKKAQAKEIKTQEREKARERINAAVDKIKTEKEKMQRRRYQIRSIRDSLNISDADIRRISKRDIRLMSDYEFYLFKQDLYQKAVELVERQQAKAEVMDIIFQKRLRKVENYRKALELPPLSEMTTDQLTTFADLLETFQEGDIFLTQRELETVDSTDLQGIRTWREARERLAAELGISVEELAKIQVSEFDEYRWDTALAERNPFYRMMVDQTNRLLLDADARFLDVERKAHELARKSNKSRSRGLIDKLIPQDKQIMTYLEAPQGDKALIAQEMTVEQLEYAHFIQEYFGQALDYLIQIKALNKGRENYFTHIRRTFLETLREDGLIKAFINLFEQYKMDEAVFNILNEDTGNILPLEKFFQFSLRRTGEIDPTSNVTRAFLSYAKALEKKKSLDALIPKLDIYAQSLTPDRYTPRGLEVDRSLKQFVNKYINSKKGRHIKWIAKQGGKIDMGIRAMRMVTSLMDLGLSLGPSVASLIGEQAMTLQGLGIKNYLLGKKRKATEQGKKIIQKYRNFTGKTVWDELTEPDKQVSERLFEALFIGFRLSSQLANENYLLGSMTEEEFQAGALSPERLSEMKIEAGRYRAIKGANSIVGSTSPGQAATQYKTWALPILRTTAKNLTTIASDLKNKGPGEALTSREMQEIVRAITMTAVVYAVGSYVISEEDDETFLGRLKQRMYKEAMTFLGGIDIRLAVSVPRIATYIGDLANNIVLIIKLEEYKTKAGLKGVERLKRQVTPALIRQFQDKETGKKGQRLKRRKAPTKKKRKKYIFEKR